LKREIRRIDLNFHGNDRRNIENNPSETRLHEAGIKDTGITYKRVLMVVKK